MIDQFAKDYLHEELQFTREALLWKLDGRTGVASGYEEEIDAAEREAHWARVEQAAKAAS